MTKQAVMWTIGIMGVPVLAVLLFVYAFANEDGRDTASVIRVVDGDTIDVSLDGEETRVRLLNVDTPETKHPSEPVECLGLEASEFLETLLPTGTDVELEYDIERLDRYDRTLAGVYHENSLVNAEIAANGLGIAVVYGPNRKFYDDVKEAEQGARDRGLGLYDPAIECALPKQLERLQNQIGQLSDELPSDIARTEDALEEVDELAESAGDYSQLIAQLRGGSSKDADKTRLLRIFYANQLDSFADQLASNEQALDSRQSELNEHKNELEREAEREREEERERLEEEQRRAEEEEQRSSEEQQREAEEQRQQQAETAEEEQDTRGQSTERQQDQQTHNKAPSQPQQTNAPQRNQPSEPSRSSSSGSSDSSNSGPPPGYGTDSDYPGYTGPRCYASGGRYWKPC